MSFNDLAKKEAARKKDAATGSPKSLADTKEIPVDSEQAAPSKT